MVKGHFGTRTRLAVALRLLGWSSRETERILKIANGRVTGMLRAAHLPYRLTAGDAAEFWEAWDRSRRRLPKHRQ